VGKLLWMEDFTYTRDPDLLSENMPVDGVINATEQPSKAIKDANSKAIPGNCQPGRTYGRCTTKFEQYKAERREENGEPWSPFADLDKWCLAEWMVKSGLSQTEINKFLKLNIVSHTRA
jgi:hypothetical protein